MAAALSPYRLNKARELFNIFNFFNAISYALLAGNIITLYAMRLNASSTLLGLLNALLYASFFFLPLGKILVKRIPIIKVYSSTTILRAVSMSLLLVTPFFAKQGRYHIALGLTLLGATLFHLCRGIGLIGNNPILQELSVGADRGSYMTLIQIINSATAMFASFALALLLGKNPNLGLYSVIMLVGIATGVFSGILMYKMPEPAQTNNSTSINFFKVLKEAFSKDSFRNFILIFLIVSFVSAIARIFVVVYSREVFLQTDGMVSLFTVFGGLGSLMMGLINKLLLDRVGAKPLYITTTIVALLSMLPVVFFPSSAIENTVTVILFLATLHFIINFGFIGTEGVAQNYFFALIPPQDTLNMGIVYYFVFGLAGASGSFMAGLLLDGFSKMGITIFLSYKILYGILILLLALVIFIQRKLIPLGALPFRGALEVMFSFRDLRAITLLDRLGRTKDTYEEEEILGELHLNPSRLSLKGLLERAKSPRLAIRIESLRALEPLENFSEEAENALMEDMVNNQYTTAYISARLLGNHGVFSAIPLLRELINSDDYMLAGECAVALARLNDTAFLPEIEKLTIRTKNPRLKIMGVTALGIYGAPNSLTALIDILRLENPPPYLRDEVVLAMSSILDIQNRFYPLLVRYLEDASIGTTLAMDEMESAREFFLTNQTKIGRKKEKKINASQVKDLEHALSEFMTNMKGTELSKWILLLPPIESSHSMFQMIMSEAVMDDELVSQGRFRLLVSSWVCHLLRMYVRLNKV